MKTPITKRFTTAKRVVDFKWKIYPTSDNEFYCELKSFYDGYLDENNRYLDKKWQSEPFKTIKECDEWAIKIITLEEDYLPIPNEFGELFDEYEED